MINEDLLEGKMPGQLLQKTKQLLDEPILHLNKVRELNKIIYEQALHINELHDQLEELKDSLNILSCHLPKSP